MSTVKPSITKGTRDFSPTDISKRNYLKAQLTAVFENFGFQPIETPSFERSETLLGKYGEEGDRLIFKILNSGDKVKNADLQALQKEELAKFSNSLSQKALRYDLQFLLPVMWPNIKTILYFHFDVIKSKRCGEPIVPNTGDFKNFYNAMLMW